jgi:transposase-like protein
MDVSLLTLPLCDIHTYLQVFSQLVFPLLGCPRCEEIKKIIKHGHYCRQAMDGDGLKYILPIQRFRCKICGKTFSYLPPFCPDTSLIVSRQSLP